MRHIKGFFIHIILIFVCFLCLLPFLWLTSTALKGPMENIFQYPPVFIPEDFTFENFKLVLALVPIIGYAINSFIVAFFTVVLNLIFSALAAYPLARMNFRGKNIVFFGILATIMVPFQAIMLPIYIITLKSCRKGGIYAGRNLYQCLCRNNSRQTGGIRVCNRMATEPHNGIRAISVIVDCPYFLCKK